MEQLLHFLDIIVEGLGITVVVTAGASVLAMVASTFAGLGRRSSVWPFRWLATSYVAIFRGTSALVQLFWVYFALPLIGLRFDAVTAGIVVLGLNTGSYGAEVVRGAIQSVPKGQDEAALALGMSPRQRLWRIIFPQAALAMIPPFGNLLIELLKNSALVSMITLSDLTFQAKEILRAEFPGQTPLIFTLVLLIYFGLSQVIAFGMKRLELKLAVGRDHGGG